MSYKYCQLNFASFVIISLCLQGVLGFFLKHVNTGKCVNDTSQIHSEGPWGNVSFVELTDNCLDPHAQFRFRANGALLNLKRKGCLAAKKKYGTGYYLPKFWVYVDKISPDRSACAQKPEKKITRAITQTPGGALSVYYKPYDEKTWNTWCAVPKYDRRLLIDREIDLYLGLTKNCDDAQDKRFNFGSLTCYGSIVKDVNCPKDQYMVVKTASYRGLPATETCGLSNDHSCETDETCLVKKQCDGQHECNITVDDSLFPVVKACQGLTGYLYFEYQCINTPKPTHFCSAPKDIKITSRNASSFSLTWNAPEKSGDSANISYTVCISHSENETCIITNHTSKRMLLAKNVNAATKYYVRVLASNKAGDSDYSKRIGFYTNGKAAKATSGTSHTLTFALEIPSKAFDSFYVVVLRLQEGNEAASPESYKNDDLVTYTEAAQNQTNPKAYVAAMFTSSVLDGNEFVLGDGKHTYGDRMAQRLRSTYYNSPLEPDTKYSIFLRILNAKGDFYSTEWSRVSKTSEYTGPSVMTSMSSVNITAKEGDLVKLLCSAEGEPPIIFTWKKDEQLLESFVDTDTPHHSSLLVLTVENQTNFGKYVCHIQDRFASTIHTIWIQEDTGHAAEKSEKVERGRKNGESSGKWLAGIIVLTILSAVLFLIVANLVYRYHFKSHVKADLHSFSNDIYDNSVQDCNSCEDEMTCSTSHKSGEEDIAVYSYAHLMGKDASQK